MAAKIFRINYKSDFILTMNSEAGWTIPFCIKFWTSIPMRAYYVGFDGTTYTHCAYDPAEPTKLLVQFDDHHLPIGNLHFQIAYHFTVEDFPNNTEDEVFNATAITTEIDGETYQVMLDFTGETAPGIDFNMPSVGVTSVNGKIGAVTLNAEDVGAQPTIEDLATIRSGAAAGATAVQPAALTPIENDIDAIEGKIPSAASTSNQLADKAFVNSALADKADTSDIPTALSQLSQDSTHRVVTDAEKSTWNGKQNAIDDLATIRNGAAAGATAVQPAAMNTALAAKQDTLTFDNTPTANSNNPVKSSGIKTALDAKQSTISTVNVTVDNNTGTPSGSASVSGSTLSLSFQNLKGATGATGATGPQGPQGERGLPGESGVTGDVSGFTVIQTIDPSATYGATDIAGAATVQATNAELTELAGVYCDLRTDIIEINGGEKQYEGEWRKGFYIDTSGQKQVSANWGRTDPIFLKAGQRVAVKTQSVHFSAIVQTDENESYYTPLVRVFDGGTELRWHVYTATEDIWVICFGKVSNNDVEAKVIYQQKYTTVSQFNSFVSEIANSYLYLGIATPSTNPGIPNRKVFYFATVAGVYTNFGSIELAKGINILKYNGSTWSVDVLSEIDSEPIAGSDNTAESNAIYDSTDWLRTEEHELKCVTAITGQYIDHDGNLQSGPSWKISKPFKVKKGQVLNMVSKSSSYSMWSKYENGTYTPLFTDNLANIKYTYICPQDMMMVLCGKIIDEWYDCTIENPSPFEGMYQKECCLLIESGSYNNGIKIAQQNRIRTRQMVNANFSLELNDGYKVVLIIYYNRSKTVEREVLTPTYTKFDIVYDGYVNIVFGKTDDSNLTGYENPVKTLTQYTNCLTSEVTSLETETNYYKHLIEYGGFNYTTIQETNDPRRLRFNKIVYKSFTVTTKSLAKIYRALHYNLEGEFTYIEEFFPYLDSYEHTGIDGVRLVFCGSSSTETAMTTTDVIKNWRTPQDEFSDNLTEDLIIQGTVNNQGQPVSSNLRCITKVLNRPFSIELNNDYIIRGYELYTKDNEPINMFTMSSTVRSLTYGCAGFNIRLILSKSNVEETISAKSNIIKSFKPRLDLSNYEICDQYELLGRPAKNACIGVITRKDGGSIWSDGKVWRKAIDNTLAISAKYYITADASTGETLAGNGENEANWIASITKAFTADLVARYVTDYNELVTIEAGDLAGVTTEVLQEGDIISIGDLLYAALLPSDNASAHTLERVIGKKINPSAATSSDARTAFLNKMQEVTQQLGMTHTSQFWNGWGALLSSCSDVVKLFKDINDNYPIINTVWSKLNHTVTITGDNARTVQVVSTTPQWARNFLSTWKGGKTGSSSTRAAYAFIWEFNNHEYISVELDCGFGRAFSERFMNAGRILDEIKL